MCWRKPISSALPESNLCASTSQMSSPGLLLPSVFCMHAVSHSLARRPPPGTCTSLSHRPRYVIGLGQSHHFRSTRIARCRHQCTNSYLHCFKTDEAIKSLCEIRQPHDILDIFITSSRAIVILPPPKNPTYTAAYPTIPKQTTPFTRIPMHRPSLTGLSHAFIACLLVPRSRGPRCLRRPGPAEDFVDEVLCQPYTSSPIT